MIYLLICLVGAIFLKENLMQKENKDNELEKNQELLDYSFKLLLIDILLKKKEISKIEHEKVKQVLKNEHFNYLNKQY